MLAQVTEVINAQYKVLTSECSADLGKTEKQPEKYLTTDYNYLINHICQMCERTCVMDRKNNARDQEKKIENTAAKRDADVDMVDATTSDIQRTVKAEVERLLKSRLKNKPNKGDSLFLDDSQTMLTDLHSLKEQIPNLQTKTKN